MADQKQLAEFISNDLAAMRVTLREFEEGKIDAATFFSCILDDAAAITQSALEGQESCRQ